MARRRLILVLLLVVATLPLSITSGTARAATPAYTITDLGTLGGSESFAYGLNAAGQVVGEAETSGGTRHAFLYSGGKMTDLGTLPGYPDSRAVDINASGQVVGTVGTANTPTAPTRAVRWQGGAPTDLGTLPGDRSGVANAINDAGQIVGYAVESAGSRLHAILWQGSGVTDLGPSRDYNGGLYNNGVATDINATGQVVGLLVHGGNGKGSPVTFREGTISPIEPALGPSGAFAVNAHGQIAGGPYRVTGFGKGVLWEDGKVTDLGTLPGMNSASASKINGSGQIVGSSYYVDPQTVGADISVFAQAADGQPRAFLWQGGAMTDLTALLSPGSGWVLTSASDINDAGQIVGTGTTNGRRHAYLLTPPIPQQCFAETGKCVQGRFLAYWQAHGGLAINGYPLSDEFDQRLDDGNTYRVQYFERVRMEYHPENATPNDVLLGQFGRILHPADPPVAAAPPATFFAQTGHNVGGRFLDYWDAHGGLPQFGLPISEEFTETLEDGNTYMVQYFERARFEYHPENAPPNDVLLGQFGRRIYGQR